MSRCLGCMTELEKKYDVCPHCGYKEGTMADSPLHMEPGALLADRYLVGKVVGYGGFGATYIGWDTILQLRVAIKEYLPSEFATRSMGQTHVTVYGGNKANQFADGMAKFVDEAKRLAQFQSEAGIVRVYDSFEANNTAYIIMEYLDGETLTSFLEREGKIPSEKALEMLTPVIQSLEVIHKTGIIHRDIAPDNIMITKDGKVKLIDFGAARYATTSHSRSLTVIIKPGYSPEEQYRSRGDQGPHTDIYALGAVFYRMVTGITPPDALERRAFFENKKKDILLPPSKNCKLPKNVETAILNAMNVRIEDRTPSADAFLNQLTSTAPVRRVMGKIKAIDLMKWPLWAKIIVPVGGVAVAVLLALLLTGRIGFANNLVTTLTLGEGMTRVPSVVNYSVSTAQDTLDEKELLSIIGGRETSDVIPANMVLRQSIPAGDIVEKGSHVELFISAEATPVVDEGKMPDIAYYTEAEATDILSQLGAVVSVEREYSNDIAEGIVIRGSIGMGEPLAAGDEVVLFVSMGPDPSMVSSKSEETLEEGTESGSEAQPNTSNEPKPVSLNRSTLSLFVGESSTLTTSGGDGSITWNSSNPSVATVSNGIVKAINKGSATITASSGGKSTSCPVTVQDYSISLSESRITLQPSENRTVTASGAPAGSPIEWSSSNTQVVTVNSGTIYAVSSGSASITAKFTQDGRTYTASCQVSVEDVGITLSQHNISNILVGSTENLRASTTPGGKSVSWKSSNSRVASVSAEGRVTAVSEGNTTITAQFTYGGKNYSDTCSVSVISVSVRLSESNMTLSAGESRRLTATTSPSSGTVSWASEDSSVATVNSSGQVTAVGAGSTLIRATVSYGGMSASSTCRVSVETPKVSVSPSSLSIKYEESSTLTAYTTPSGQVVEWSSSNSSVASVSSSGKVVARSAGDAQIYAKITVSGQTYSGTCSVHVEGGSPPSISLGWVRVWLKVGQTDTISTMGSSTTEDAPITWNSSDSSVLRVDSGGNVTALSPGTVTVTATITNQWGSASDTCTIVVEGSANQTVPEDNNSAGNTGAGVSSSGPSFSGESASISGGEISISGSVYAGGGLDSIRIEVENSSGDRCAFTEKKVGTPFSSPTSYSLSELSYGLNASISRWGTSLENDTFTVRITASEITGNNGSERVTNSTTITVQG